ncbi:site-specific DNA-methyltransferase [Candidatus Poribacteria bacterium]|nr:site-specific DNA-methyltransferase [Candidatus Poribacteria bacterium]MYG07237.1 site-specific DNA-methyltransferase [Candidatus Poribacteria bacterium]MYK21690.1 site-specific DNA-methyltransferase [Candidatus Poribacteria bacterium]
MNKLYFGDNLEILREMPDERVHLICTDPPFNSGRDYNTFLGDSLAQKKAFTDTWTWDTAAQDARADIEQRAFSSDTYKALDTCLKGYDLVLQNAVSGNKGAMRAYLAFMGPRLAEMHRVLTSDGSIYLHCDPTASHYLKGIMDAIWDQQNHGKNEYFKNEIVWHYYNVASTSKKFYGRKHDIILFYSAGQTWTFNGDQMREPYAENSNWVKASDSYGDARYKPHPDGKRMHDVWRIPTINNMAKERLGYPTQKPRALYERMIKASSNEGDIVLDPFCGCGTTIDAAHTLNRQWMGIDITILALDPMRQRLADRHGLEPSVDYQIEGYPTNMQEVQKLLKEGDKRKYHDFSNWAVTRLGLRPTKDVGDGGLDGVGHVTLWNPQQLKETNARILAEVKTGKPTITQVRAFCRVMDKNNAEVGIFITLEPVTAKMRQEAQDMGTFEHNNKTYPRLQFWQLDDAYFENPDIINTVVRLPDAWRIRPTQKSERHFEDRQMQLLRG